MNINNNGYSRCNNGGSRSFQPWTEKEDLFIKKHYEFGDNKKICEKLGRSIQAICQRAVKLGISKEEKSVDLVGKVFGKLTVIKKSEKVRKYNGQSFKSYWTCMCKCGRVVEAATCRLNSGSKKSCNLGTCNPRILANAQGLINKAYYTHLYRAKKRGIVSHLSVDQYTKIAMRPCTYCGNFSVRKHGNLYSMKFNSVDRKNNEPYYKLSNSQSTCFVCQNMKQTLSNSDFLKQVNKINNFVTKK